MNQNNERMMMLLDRPGDQETFLRINIAIAPLNKVRRKLCWGKLCGAGEFLENIFSRKYRLSCIVQRILLSGAGAMK